MNSYHLFWIVPLTILFTLTIVYLVFLGLKKMPKDTLQSLNSHHEELLTNLKQSVQIFDDLHIRYLLFGGALLGLVRNGCLIPWDDDIDLLVLQKDWNENKNVLATKLDQLGYRIKPVVFGYKIISKKNPHLFIDIFIAKTDNLQNIFDSRLTLEMIGEPRRVLLENHIQVVVPEFTHDYLNAQYGKESLQVGCITNLHHPKYSLHVPICFLLAQGKNQEFFTAEKISMSPKDASWMDQI